jgi:hypothetical protein
LGEYARRTLSQDPAAEVLKSMPGALSRWIPSPRYRCSLRSNLKLGSHLFCVILCTSERNVVLLPSMDVACSHPQRQNTIIQYCLCSAMCADLLISFSRYVMLTHVYEACQQHYYQLRVGMALLRYSDTSSVAAPSTSPANGRGRPLV